MIPPRHDPRWGRLVDDPGAHTYKLLPLRILMQRIAIRQKRGMSPEERKKAIDDLYNFFDANARIAEDEAAALFA